MKVVTGWLFRRGGPAIVVVVMALASVEEWIVECPRRYGQRGVGRVVERSLVE
jgi:hypothetical protein